MCVKTGLDKICVVCGKQFYVRRAYIKRGAKYCSFECYQEQRKKRPKSCATCNAEFIPHNKAQLFCSHRCSKVKALNPNWNGGVFKRGVSRLWARMIFSRDDYICTVCGTWGGELNAHHLDGYKWCKEKRFDSNNGTTLCSKCHREFHKIYGRRNNTAKQFNEYKRLKEN